MTDLDRKGTFPHLCDNCADLVDEIERLVECQRDSERDETGIHDNERVAAIASLLIANEHLVQSPLDALRDAMQALSPVRTRRTDV